VIYKAVKYSMVSSTKGLFVLQLTYNLDFGNRCKVTRKKRRTPIYYRYWGILFKS